MGLYTPTILGGNSYLSWFYDRGAIKDPAHTGTSKGLSQAINRRPIRKFQPKYATVYVTIQNHGLSAGVRTDYVTANGVRDGLTQPQTMALCAHADPDLSPPTQAFFSQALILLYLFSRRRGMQRQNSNPRKRKGRNEFLFGEAISQDFMVSCHKGYTLTLFSFI